MWGKKKKTRFRNYKVVSTKKYDNPFFKHRKRERVSIDALPIKMKLYAFIFLAITVFFAWGIIYSSLFKIVSIEVNFLRPNEVSSISIEEIQDVVIETIKTKYVVFPKDNILMVTDNGIVKKISENFAFENIEVRKKIFKKILIVDITEHEYAIVWKEGEQYYYISQDGSVISEVAAEDIKSNFPLVDNIENFIVRDGRLDIEENNLEFIKKIYTDNKDRNIFSIEKFVYNQGAYNSMTIKTLEGPELYFNTEKDIENQLTKLELLKADKLKDNFQSKEYVDLRYGDMVYYK